MLEIIAIIYLSGKIATLAERKGQKKGAWRFYMIISWIGAELLGIFLSIVIFHAEEIFSMLPLAYGFAIGSYFILRSVLNKMPDVDNGFEFEQQTPQV
jgi:hypothetical protein